MQFTELKKSIGNGEKFSVYLVEGEDAYFRESALKTLINAFAREPSLNVATFDKDTFEIGGMLASLNAFPLLSDNRITVLKEYYPTAAALKGGIRDFLENPVKGSILVVVNEKTGDALKKFKSTCVVSCGKADASVVARWIRATARASEVEISDALALKVAEYCLSDMMRVKNETEKLIAYVGAGGTVDEEAIDLLVFRDSEYKIFEMTDHVAKRRFDAAVSVVNEMLGRGETPQRILSSVYNYFRRLLTVSVSSGSDAEIADMLGVKEYAVKKAKEQAAKFRVRAIKAAVDGLCDADYAIKSGRAEADAEMWINVFKIMTE